MERNKRARYPFDAERSVYKARMQAMQAHDEEVLDATQGQKDKFFARVRKTESCHYYEPAGALGYGAHKHRGHKYQASRFALLLARGLPPQDGQIYYACHLNSCSAKNCVNEKHLYFGTPAQNMADVSSDPRNFTEAKLAAASYRKKFTDHQVEEIFRLFYEKRTTQFALADKFDCAESYVSALLNRRYRKPLTLKLHKKYYRARKSLALVGEDNNHASFDNQQIQTLRKILCAGFEPKEVAHLLGRTYSLVRQIQTGRLWGDLPWPDGCAPLTAEEREEKLQRSAPSGQRFMQGTRPRAELSDVELCEIHREYWEQNGNGRAMAVARNIHHGLISVIVNRKYKGEVTAHLPQPPRKKVVAATRRIGTGRSKLGIEQVQAIRQRLNQGEPDATIWPDYKGCTPNMVADIRMRRSWQKLPWPDA